LDRFGFSAAGGVKSGVSLRTRSALVGGEEDPARAKKLPQMILGIGVCERSRRT
jgi:hypothetical protein